MENQSINKVWRGLIIFMVFILTTTLIGEYVISREVNGWVQFAATAVWLWVSVRCFHALYKLI
jgi:hypothetical protein